MCALYTGPEPESGPGPEPEPETEPGSELIGDSPDATGAHGAPNQTATVPGIQGVLAELQEVRIICIVVSLLVPNRFACKQVLCVIVVTSQTAGTPNGTLTQPVCRTYCWWVA